MTEKNPNKNLKLASIVSLILLATYIGDLLLHVSQTKYQLVSPLIPRSLVWEINKQLLFTALVAAIAGIVALVLHFYKRYLLVMILVVVALIGCRYVYI